MSSLVVTNASIPEKEISVHDLAVTDPQLAQWDMVLVGSRPGDAADTGWLDRIRARADAPSVVAVKELQKAYTAKFRAQYGELLNVAKAMGNLMQPEQLRKDATEMRHRLSVLHGKLSVHLAVEDKSLYRCLLNYHDGYIRATTRKTIDEMGSLAGAFKAYVGRRGALDGCAKGKERYAKERLIEY